MLPRLAVLTCLALAVLAGRAPTVLALPDAEQAPAPEVLPTPPAPAAQTLPPPKAAPPPPPPPPARARLANVRVDLRITDVRGGQDPITKTLSLTVGDRQQGMVRTTAEFYSAKGGQRHVLPLNVDAKPVIEGDRVRLQLSLDYNIVSPNADATTPTSATEVRESLGMVLESGKPLVVSESADPLSDRRVKLEVTATILP
jgi:hypothetical protein